MLTIKTKSRINAFAQVIFNSIITTLKISSYHFAPSKGNTKPETQRELKQPITVNALDTIADILQPLRETNW